MKLFAALGDTKAVVLDEEADKKKNKSLSSQPAKEDLHILKIHQLLNAFQL